MKNRKGQALVEFIVIMPVVILMILGVFDLGNILYQKYHLENDLDYITMLYQNKEVDALHSYQTQNKLNIVYEEDSNFVTIRINKKVRVNMPLSNLFMKNPYIVEVKRVIYREKS